MPCLVLAVACALALSSSPPSARAQLPPDFDQSVPASDYYTANAVTETRLLLKNVEQYHLTKANFWANYRSGHYVYAQADLIFILRRFPNHPRALYLMEALAEKTGDRGYPLAFYERALRLYPKYPVTRARYGRYLASIGQREAGIVELRAALAADSTLVQARAWIDDARAGLLKPARIDVQSDPQGHAP
jgi:tetratricopeptide (TPR) repeat protein